MRQKLQYLLDNFRAADSSGQECSKSVNQQEQMLSVYPQVQMLSH